MSDPQAGGAPTRILLQDALRPSRLGFAERVRSLLGAGNPGDETWEEVEEALISADQCPSGNLLQAIQRHAHTLAHIVEWRVGGRWNYTCSSKAIAAIHHIE